MCSESRFSEKRFGLKEVPSVYSRWCSYHRKEASSILKAKARSFLVNTVNEFRLQITESCSVLIQPQRPDQEKKKFMFNHCLF